MTKDDFLKLLRHSSAIASGFAKNYVLDELPKDFTYSVTLNASSDDPSLTQFDIYPNDNGKIVELVEEKEVIELLCRKDKVPVWIDISVESVYKAKTIFRLLCAGRYSDKLLELHKTRIKEQEYLDSSYHILTQDIIYAAVKYIDKFDKGEQQESALKRLIKVDKTVTVISDKAVLKGSFTNYIENEKEKKRIGDLGELLVLQHEQEKLKSLGINKEPQHKSKAEGDGLGYDILSFDEDGNEIFIEVKTTSNGVGTPFYITRNELERSRQDGKKFFLYRLYEFDDTNNKAKYYKQQGDLTELCVNPILYRAIVSE